MLESIVSSVRCAVNNKKNENGVKNNEAVKNSKEIGLVDGGGFSIWTCLTDCGSTHESEPEGEESVYNMPGGESPGPIWENNPQWDAFSSDMRSSPFTRILNTSSPSAFGYPGKNGNNITEERNALYKPPNEGHTEEVDRKAMSNYKILENHKFHRS